MLVLIALLLLYLILRDLLARAHPPFRNPLPDRASASGRRDVKPAGHGPSQAYSRDEVRPGRIADRPKAEVSSVPVTGPSTSASQTHRQRQVHASTTLALQSGLASSDIVQLTKPPAATLPSTASISTLGPSFMMKFADLKVNNTRPRLSSPARASRRVGPTPGSQARGRTLSLSPLSSPPSSPPPSPSPSTSPSLCRTPAGSRGHAHAGPGAVDFSLYKKKIRTLTKSPKKFQTKAAGKLRADSEAATDVTTTAWFYKITTDTKLLVMPPDLTGHPDGLLPGDIYFDRVGDTFQLWLWRFDDADEPHWTKIPFGYQRDDGKHLIVTPKNHLLLWVTPSYYKAIDSTEKPSVSGDKE